MHPIDLAQFWPGYEVVACRPSADNTLLIELEPQAGGVPNCGRCGQACPLIHERRLRRVRDRDLLDQRVLLQMPVLWVGHGNSREAIRPFFELLGEHCQRIEAVAMDMNTAFDLEVQRHCPQAEVVYDLFHVVARYGREVIDRIRVDQANHLRDDKPARKVVKQSRWLLLRNRENLKDGQVVQLQELLDANQPLATVYVLKDALKEIWYAPSVREGWRRWRTWLRHARDSGLAPLQRFARNLRKYARGILASARFPLHTSVLEGVNNRIKVIKRMAYGFRDSAYFFLKIKAAFPGKAR